MRSTQAAMCVGTSTGQARPSGRAAPRVAARVPWVTLTVALAALGIALSPGAPSQLEYARAAISDGAIWRGVTGHLVHFSPSHAAWNALGFVCLGAACEIASRRRYLIAVAASAVAISLTLWSVLPGVEHYRGLSGINSALFALFAVGLARERLAAGDWLIATAVSVLSIGFLWHTFAAWGAQETILVSGLGAGVIPVPLAHVTGLAAGAAAAVNR